MNPSSVAVYSASHDEILYAGDIGPDGQFGVRFVEVDPRDGTEFEHAALLLGPKGREALAAFFASYVPSVYDPIALGC